MAVCPLITSGQLRVGEPAGRTDYLADFRTTAGTHGRSALAAAERTRYLCGIKSIIVVNKIAGLWQHDRHANGPSTRTHGCRSTACVRCAVDAEITDICRDNTFKQLKIDQLTHEMAVLKRLKIAARSEVFNAVQRQLFEETIDDSDECEYVMARKALCVLKPTTERPHELGMDYFRFRSLGLELSSMFNSRFLEEPI